MKHSTCRKLRPDVAVGRIAVALAAAAEVDRSVRIPASFRAGDPLLVRQVPSWVARVALMKSQRAWWLWCEPRRVRARDAQCVLDLPEGRYMVETLDTRSHTWVSCEAAAGSPLVIGLPYTGRPVLACIRRVAVEVQIPRE
ncbi:MAG: hypothetical protein NTY02_01940 [Acidobacteria bacterium]|nr:hypothetical protein [Acidobacteriota bacterium]